MLENGEKQIPSPEMPPVFEAGIPIPPDDLARQASEREKLIVELARLEAEQKKDDRARIESICRDLGVTRGSNELLLTSEEEARVERGERYVVSGKSGEQQVEVIGVAHTNQLENVKDIERELDEMNPDLVLVEGDPLEIRFPGETIEEILAMNPKAVMAQEEQVYLAWLAKKQGREVRSWDLPAAEQLRNLLGMKDERGKGKYSQEEAMSWLITYGLRKIYEQGKAPSVESLQELILFGMPGVDALVDLSSERVSGAVYKTTSKSLDELKRRVQDPESRAEDQKLVTEISDPRTNQFARDMNVARDRHAIEVIQQAKQNGYKKIFVTAGSSHAVTWERAINAIYPE